LFLQISSRRTPFALGYSVFALQHTALASYQVQKSLGNGTKYAIPGKSVCCTSFGSWNAFIARRMIGHPAVPGEVSGSEESKDGELM